MASKIKKGDMVEIMCGKNQGERGKILRLYPEKKRAIVEGFNMVKKHRKATQNQEGGIIEMEAPIHLSNLMVIDPSDDRPCRVGFEDRDGKKVRVSRRTGHILD